MLQRGKHIMKKLLLYRIYERYVISNDLIKEDIAATITSRGCNVLSPSIKRCFFHLMLYYPEYAMIFFWRIKKSPWYANYYTKDFACKIFKSTKIEGGLMCYHPFATVINAKYIGENFEFRNGLTIGNKDNNNELLPIIGNNVTVGANVVIIGDIKIGDNVIIGAGSVVVKNVPSDVVVAGNPAKIIKPFHG